MNHEKYVTTPEFNKLTAEYFAARLAQANLATESDIADFVNKTDFDDKLKDLSKRVTSSKTKHLLVENEKENYKHWIQAFLLVKVTLIMMEHIFFLIFQPIYKTISAFSGLPYTVSECESKGLANEKTKPPYTANKSLSPKLVWMSNSKIRWKVTGSCLKQDFATFIPNNVVNLFVVYELDRSWHTKFTLKYCSFGNVKVTKNAYPNKYSYSGYGFGFDSQSFLSIPNFDWGKNVIIFGIDMSSSAHANDKNKDILILY